MPASKHPSKEPKRAPDALLPLKLLSLDGGGVRGLSSITILEHLMDRVNKRRAEKGLAPQEPWQVFDMIGGTSTGGLIAIMLGRLHMSVSECKRKYQELAASAFTPANSKFNLPARSWRFISAGAVFDPLKLEAAIDDIISQAVHRNQSGSKTALAKDILLYNPDTESGNTCKTFVVATDEDTTRAVLFRSYQNPQREADLLESCRIWEACRATSAATTFFPPLSIGNRTFLDGGVLHNNPVELVNREAMDLWPNETPLLLSIGTGVAPEKPFKGDLAAIIRRLKDIATETEKTHVSFQDGSGRVMKSRNKYFRFNAPEIGSIGLEEWQKMKELEESTVKYISRNLSQTESCVEKLLEVDTSEIRDRNKKIIRWISEIPVQLDHSIVKEKIGHVKVGKWVIDKQLAPWVAAKNATMPVFWLRGVTGMGKTSIMSQIIEWYQEKLKPGEQVAYFYCSRAFNNRQDPVEILRSILAQLSSTRDYSTVHSSILAEYNERIEKDTLDVKFSLKETTKLLGQIAGDNSIMVTLIIDGLDECNDFSKLLLQLKQLFAEAPSLKIVLASRMQVLRPPNFPSQKEVVITSQTNAEDIKNYVHSQVFERDIRLLNDAKPEVREKFEKTLEDSLNVHAQGMFRWVELQLATFFPVNRDVLRRRDVEKKLRNLQSSVPQQLGEVYEQIYNMNAAHDTEDLVTVERVYKWMLGVKRNLTFDELIEAISVNKEANTDPHGEEVTKDYIKRVCANFIIGHDTENGTTVQFAHASVKDYLESRRSGEYARGPVHGQIAESCLLYLSRVEREMINEVYDKDGFPNYALAYWPWHVSEASANGFPMTIKDLSDLFSPERFAVWVKMIRDKAINLRHDHDNSIQDKLQDCVSETPNRLFLACAWNIVDLVKYLITNPQTSPNFDVNELNENKETALYIASKYGHHEIAEKLLGYGAEVDKECGQLCGALQVAASNGHTNIVRLLLSQGANVKLYDFLALIEASRNGYEPVVQLLMCSLAKSHAQRKREKMEKPNSRDVNGVTLLIPYAQEQHTREVVAQSDVQLTSSRHVRIDTNVTTAENGISIEEGFQYSLLAAARNNHKETITALLDKAPSVGILRLARKEHINEALRIAVKKGHESLVQLLLSKWEADPFHVGEAGYSAIEVAAQNGYEELVNSFLDTKPSGDIQDLGSPALLQATKSGHWAIVESLIEKGARISSAKVTIDALKAAVRDGNEKVVKLLLHYSQNLDDTYGIALTEEAEDGNEAAVNLLLLMGATDSDDDSDNPVMQNAAANIHEKAIKLLLDHDAESNNPSIGTSLQRAAGAGHELIVRLLLDHNADPNTAQDQESPLAIAVKNGHLSIARLLLDNGADCNAIGPSGSALQLATEYGSQEMVRLLIDRGADVNASNNRGTALQLAASAGRQLIVGELLRANPDIDAAEGGITPLQGAAARGHKGITNLLLTRAADVNCEGRDGTALHNAAAGGHKAVVDILLAHGANINAECGKYGTALQAAIMEGKVAIVEYLLEKGARDFSHGGSRRWNESTSTWEGEEGNSLENGDIGHEVAAGHRDSILRMTRVRAAKKAKVNFHERVAIISRNQSRLNLDGLSSSRRSSLNMDCSPPQSPLLPLSRTASRGRSPLGSPRMLVSEDDVEDYITMRQQSRS